MSYNIVDVARNVCRIELAPETELIEQAKLHPQQYEETLLPHYQKLLEEHIHEKEAFLKLTESSEFLLL